eukprot:4871817-Prymnesium_polylepis.1
MNHVRRVPHGTPRALDSRAESSPQYVCKKAANVPDGMLNATSSASRNVTLTNMPPSIPPL